MTFRLVLLALSVLAFAFAELEYLDGPVEQWSIQVGKNIVAGNSVSISPDDSLVLVTTDDGTMVAINAETKSITTTITLADLGLVATTCKSGIRFFESEGETYAIYAVYEESNQVSYLIRTKADGSEPIVGQGLEGQAVGTPVVSSDGALAFINTNMDNEGIFNCVNTETMKNHYIQKGATSLPRGAPGPFAPIGIYHNPIEGNYDVDGFSGAGNDKDILFWANAYPESAIGNRFGARYIFQLPLDWKKGNDDTGFNVLAAEKNGWTTNKAPVLYDQGRSAIFGTTRNGFKGWAASSGSWQWQDGPTDTTDYSGDGQFGRGVPRWAAPYTTPVVTKDDGTGYLVAGLAGNAPALAVMRMPGFKVIETFNSGSIVNNVISQPVLSHDKDRVYWVSNNDSILHATSLPVDDEAGVENAFSVGIDATDVEADFSLSSDGVHLYIGDKGGNVLKMAVANDGTTARPSFNQSPTSMPSMFQQPSLSPSGIPSSYPTERPTLEKLPSAKPTTPPTRYDDCPTSLPSNLEILIQTNTIFRTKTVVQREAKLAVDESGNMKATYGRKLVFESGCSCQDNDCPGYDIKFQGTDGHIIVLPVHGRNRDRIWRSGLTKKGDNEMILGLDSKSLQVWEVDNKGCPVEKVWDSVDNSDTINCSGRGSKSKCFDGISVLMKSGDKGISFTNDKAVVKVNGYGDFVCMDDGVILYESDCTCVGGNRLRRKLTSCPTSYEVKLQGDGNVIVRPENANNNFNVLWKSDKRNDPGKYAFVVNSNSNEKRCQVWELQNSCPSALLWDSIDDEDVPNCYGN